MSALKMKIKELKDENRRLRRIIVVLGTFLEELSPDLKEIQHVKKESGEGPRESGITLS